MFTTTKMTIPTLLNFKFSNSHSKFNYKFSYEILKVAHNISDQKVDSSNPHPICIYILMNLNKWTIENS